MTQTLAIAAAAAALVVEEGMEYGAAKRKAAQALAGRGGGRNGHTGRGSNSRAELPSNEEVEDAVREHIELFLGAEQAQQLQALREVAVRWMQRLAPFRPHLGGAVWRGTATKLSAVHLDLYCDDTKAAEIHLINEGVDYDSADLPGYGREPLTVLTITSPNTASPNTFSPSAASPSTTWREPVTVHLILHDLDDQRGALKPDSRGHSWRGDLAGLQRRMADLA